MSDRYNEILEQIPEAEIDAGARALREHQMAGRITAEWGKVSRSAKTKWFHAAAKVLVAARMAAATETTHEHD